MAPTPCLVGLPKTWTVAHVCSINGLDTAEASQMLVDIPVP